MRYSLARAPLTPSGFQGEQRPLDQGLLHPGTPLSPNRHAPHRQTEDGFTGRSRQSRAVHVLGRQFVWHVGSCFAIGSLASSAREPTHVRSDT